MTYINVLNIIILGFIINYTSHISNLAKLAKLSISFISSDNKIVICTEFIKKE